MKSNIKILVLIMLAATVFSCSDDGYADYNEGQTSVKALSGHWYAKLYNSGGQALTGYALLDTYNTAADNGKQMWINDNGNLYDFAVKCPVNLTSKSFSGDDLQNNSGDDIKIKIFEGKVLDKATTTAAGNVADSIYFKAKFSDDPDNEYIIAGFRRTGFLEDEH